MEGLKTAWLGLGTGRRVIVVLASLGVFAAVLALSRSAAERDLALLYAGLDRPAIGSVSMALDQRGVPYEVRGDSVFVPAQDRDVLRLSLAAEGVPAMSGQGYELLDNLSGFGTTSQMFDAAYWRAKEGELARTILALPNIRSARVHISTPTNRPFQRDHAATAAVTVGTSGGPLSAEQVQALRFLVASAVSGLTPQDVAVIDAQHGLIPADGHGYQAGLDHRSEELRARAQRLLEARVGVGNAVVELTVEPVTERESIFERRLDPDSRIAISTDVEESSRSSQDGRDASVSVASNLPDGDAAGGGGALASEETGSRALTNFDMSETSREILRVPGGVRRLTVAVLVNDPVTTDAAGAPVAVPRPQEELDNLRELVASAVGFDAERGDVITVRAMAFEVPPVLGTEATLGTAGGMDFMALARLAVLGLVALVLGLFVIRPILMSGRRAGASATTLGLAPPETFPPTGALPTILEDVASAAPGLPAPSGLRDGPTEDPVVRLRQLIADRQEETAQILQSWIEEPDPKERV
ncbi:MAG: flagellar M-ring protein FliF [Rubellimicrobium sp.]|nr:flagellar M-ring protein FliF [Rubellimicrobium sp.]